MGLQLDREEWKVYIVVDRRQGRNSRQLRRMCRMHTALVSCYITPGAHPD